MQATRIIALVLGFFTGLSSVRADESPVVADAVIGLVKPGDMLMHTFTLSQGTEPVTWSNFTFAGYTPNYGGSGSGPLNSATFDAGLHKFTWDTTGSPRGDYRWRITATNQFGSDEGRLDIAINILIPEPGSLALAGIGITGLLGLSSSRLVSRASNAA